MEVTNQLHINSIPKKSYQLPTTWNLVGLFKIRWNVKLALYMHSTHTAEREVGLHSLLMLALDVDGHLHTPGTFHPMEPPPSIQWTGCWLGPRAQLDLLEKWNIFYPARKWTMDCPASLYASYDTLVLL